MKKMFAIVITISCLGWFPWVSNAFAATGSDGTVKTREIFDSNGDKLFEDLAEKMAEAGPDENLPVIAVFTDSGSGNRASLLRQLLGNFILRHEYKNFPGMSLELNLAKIMILASLDIVHHIEYDKPVTFAIDDAGYWFGASPAKYDFGLAGNGTVVAIVDSGIDGSHVDLDEGKIIGWKDFVQWQPEPYDDNGHGTALAGIIAGDGDGNSDYTGIANGAKLVGVKVVPATGLTLMSNVLIGIDWCISNKDAYGIDVINVSLGSVGMSDGSDIASLAVNRAVESGMVTVVAAGNEGPGEKTIGTPAAAEKAITVGAMADVAEGGFFLGYFSGRGPTADGRIKPDIVAPGVYITCCVANSVNQYESYSGTSLSAPFLSGVAALILEANPALTPLQIKDILCETAEDWGETGKDNDYGCGRLNAYRAIETAGGYSGTPIDTPVLLSASENLPGFGLEDIWEFTVDDTRYPIAITLLENSTTCFLSAVINIFQYPSNIELTLIDPDGQVVDKVNSITRQADLSYTPTKTGNYRIKVTSTLNSGLFVKINRNAEYSFDLSAGADQGVGLILLQDQ